MQLKLRILTDRALQEVEEQVLIQLKIQILVEGQVPRRQRPLEKQAKEHIEARLQVLELTRQEVAVQGATEEAGHQEVVDQVVL